MPIGHFEDIEKLYNEKIKDAPKGLAIHGEGAEVGKLPTDTFPTTDKEGEKAFDDNGPENADGFKPVEVDPAKKREKSAYNETELSQKVTNEKNDQKSVKKEAAKINNSTMKENNNKTSFDRLFEDVMGDTGEDFSHFGGDEPMDDGGEDLGGDEMGDTVTLELDREVAEKLHEVLMGVLDSDLGDDDVDVEELPDEGGDEEEFGESHVDIAPAKDSVSQMAGMNNKVGGDANPGGGSADSGAHGQEDGGKPKPMPDAVSKLTGKNNKVGGKVTGGNKHMFKH